MLRQRDTRLKLGAGPMLSNNSFRRWSLKDQRNSGEQIVVLRVAVNVGGDERAARHDAAALDASERERVRRQL
jgi:hypothetical protein